MYISSFSSVFKQKDSSKLCCTCIMTKILKLEPDVLTPACASYFHSVIYSSDAFGETAA